MLATSNTSRSFTSLTIDEIRWLKASNAFGDDWDSVHSVPSTDLAESQSITLPKSSRSRYSDNRRRSILLDDFLSTSNTSSRSVDGTKARFGFAPSSSRSETPPPSPDDILPSTPLRIASYSTADSSPGDMPCPPRPTEWLYRRPRSPSTLSRSPSSLSNSPSSISRTSSRTPSIRSLTPTPSRLRTPTGYRPRTPTTVSEMNMSPFYSTVAPPLKRAPSLRAGTPSSHGTKSLSRSSPNLLDFRPSPRSKTLASRPPLPIHRERSGSESSISTTSSAGSLPRTPPSPSIYSHSLCHPHPDTRSTTPTRSILTLSPKRSASISTKHSSASKSVKFNDAPTRFTGDNKIVVGDGKVRGEEWNSRVLDGVDDMSMDVDEMDVFEGCGTQAPPSPPGKTQASTLKRFLTLRTRSKNKTRPEISGPYALTPAAPDVYHSSAHRDAETQSLFNPGSPSSSRYAYPASSASSFIHSRNDLSTIPSSPNGSADLPFSPHSHKATGKSSSLLGPGEVGVLPEHTPFLSQKFYSHPTRFKQPGRGAGRAHRHGHGPGKAASLTSSGSVGLLATEPRPVLHALPSMESFRSVKSTRSYNRFKDWLGRIGIGVAA